MNKKTTSSPSPTQLLIKRLDEFMRERYFFRQNILKGDVEYCDREQVAGQYEPVTESTINSICIEAQSVGIELWDRDIKRLIYSVRTPTYHPLDDYLDHLPAWDGIDRIRPLADMLPTRHSCWSSRFYIWFLGMVAQWQQMDTMYGNCVVPLLTGPQGCGKSTWCRRLLPPALQGYMAESLDITNRREAELALGRFALINLDEFDSIKTTQQSFLKHLLQKPIVNARMAYARSIRTARRYSTFIATCNNQDLLTDPTGSRRFICIELHGQIDNSQPIDYEQLYAQAVAALKQGERYWFTPDEEKANIAENKRFQQVSIEEQLFQQYFRKPEEEEKGEWISSAAILLKLRKLSGVRFGNTHMEVFGRILRRNGIKQKHTKQGNLWQVMMSGNGQETI